MGRKAEEALDLANVDDLIAYPVSYTHLIRALNYLSIGGMCLFMAFFVFMLNQDVQRFIFGNWG